jgi:hypothetical protein
MAKLKRYETPYMIREAFLSRERAESRAKQGWQKRVQLTRAQRRAIILANGTNITHVAINHGTESKFKWAPLAEVLKIARSAKA